MAEVRRITGGVAGLSAFIKDGSELAKGMALVDSEHLSELACHENQLLGRARGSGSAKYQVTVTFGEDATDVSGACSCPAARSRPFCKHAAGLLVAWSRMPEAFATATAPAPSADVPANKRDVKKGAPDSAELRQAGVEQVLTLVKELSLSGVAAMGRERPGQVGEVATALRANGLPRMAEQAEALSKCLETISASRGPVFEPTEYTEQLVHMQLAARKLQKHLGGDPMEDALVEALIDQEWTNAEPAPVSGLRLLGYGFQYCPREENSDTYRYEMRYVDVDSGRHYRERLRIPSDEQPRPSDEGQVLHQAMGSQYPGFAPHRVEVKSRTRQAAEHVDLKALLAVAHPNVASAVAAFIQQSQRLFTPHALPVVVRAEALRIGKGRAHLVDADGQALFLPTHAKLEEFLHVALESVTLRAVLGNVRMSEALPTLQPMALVVETADALEFVLFQNGGILEPSTLSRTERADAAREAGASDAALALIETRDTLADLFSHGLAALEPREVAPLAARLKALGLEKPGALLEALAGRPESQERLDDFMKVFQVVSLAVTRLSAQVQVAPMALAPVATRPSLWAYEPETLLSPKKRWLKQARQELSPHHAAAQEAWSVVRLDAEALLRGYYPLWSDAVASRRIPELLAPHGERALQAARGALAPEHSRLVRHTGLRVLGALGGPEARRELEAVKEREADFYLKQFAATTLQDLLARAAGDAEVARLKRQRRDAAADLSAVTRMQPVEPWALVRNPDYPFPGPTENERQRAMHQLAEQNNPEVMPALRQAVRRASSLDTDTSMMLALLNDGTGCWRLLSRALFAVPTPGVAAHPGTYGVSVLGDIHCAALVADACLEGKPPDRLAEAWSMFNLAGLHVLMDLAEYRPEALERKSLREHMKPAVFMEQFKPEVIAREFLARLEPIQQESDFADRAAGLLWLAKRIPLAAKQIAEQVLRLPAVTSHPALHRQAQELRGA
ncbi:HEAT repeat domain-containing protein [Corallococcus sp. M34]|uniref:HEAT repeat domain-containing protein n=1 Tax=Citreicoccus inhibens TaxID=2849499 RepID=UPI001C2383B6|nr:HEAT repeat domain-containing protein [Citreicoccus inhibens]MBU8896668.1 HEAT repeat domain-containing protein [Citreicoccus inhibens]